MGRPVRNREDWALIAKMGERLKWVRLAYGASQAEMAERVGLHQTAWGLYERGKRSPDQFEAPRLMAKLGLTRGYLLYGDLTGVAPELAIRLAASHPELADQLGKAPRTDTGLS